MKTLVIHPNDPSTGFLDVLYKGRLGEYVLLTEKDSNSMVDDMLRSDEFDCVMMLGHGTEYGLLAPNGNDMFGRLIISGRNVQALRDYKKLIGIWCNANIFAEKYGLSGLFSGMVVSELSEAADWNISASEEELMEHRRLWAQHLAESLDKHPDNLEEVCKEMNCHITEKSSLLEKFNYESVYSF